MMLVIFGQFIGMVFYILFEWVICGSFDECLDIYLVGIVFFEMFIGYKFYIGDFFIQVVWVYVNKDVFVFLQYLVNGIKVEYDIVWFVLGYLDGLVCVCILCDFGKCFVNGRVLFDFFCCVCYVLMIGCMDDLVLVVFQNIVFQLNVVIVNLVVYVFGGLID